MLDTQKGQIYWGAWHLTLRWFLLSEHGNGVHCLLWGAKAWYDQQLPRWFHKTYFTEFLNTLYKEKRSCHIMLCLLLRGASLQWESNLFPMSSIIWQLLMPDKYWTCLNLFISLNLPRSMARQNHVEMKNHNTSIFVVKLHQDLYFWNTFFYSYISTFFFDPPQTNKVHNTLLAYFPPF